MSTRASVSVGVGLGAVAGLAWACGLRSWMQALAGFESAYSWATELAVLVPGTVAGALLGFAAVLRLAGRPAGRWLVASPLVTAVVVLVPSYFLDLITTGRGGGALLVPLTAMATAFAVASGGAAWLRTAVGVVGVAGLAAVAAIPALLQPELVPGTPRGLFVLVQGLSLILVFSAAATLPYAGRTVVGRAGASLRSAPPQSRR